MSKMQKLLKKRKLLLVIHFITLSLLLLELVLCRYVFFGLHGMKEWPLTLLVAGMVSLLISLLTGKHYAPWFTSIGYFFGFWIGILFHTQGFDPGGGKTDNLWSIWMVVFLGCILAGFLFEFMMKWWRLLKKR